MDFFSKIIREYSFSRKELAKLNTAIAGVVQAINAGFRDAHIPASAVLGGSAAKGTMLRGDFDVDVFARFDYSYKDADISSLLKTVLTPLFKITQVDGSRDYYQFKVENLVFEVIPVLAIADPKEAMNVTDASPLHVVWVGKQLARNPSLREEIILAKVFLKANRLYGAESFIKGFSGHMVDILTIHYGGFLPLLKAASEWRPGVVVDPNSHSSTPLNKSKLGPLVLIDPVQPDRNAAAALSDDNFVRFQQLAIAFLQDPDERYFKKEPINVNTLKKKSGTNTMIILQASPLTGKKDVVGGQLLKAYEYIGQQLASHDFQLIETGWEWGGKGQALFWLMLDPIPLSAIKDHPGPPLNAVRHAEAFRQQYRQTYVKNKRLYARIPRRYTKPETLMHAILGSEYVKSKVKFMNLKMYSGHH